MEKTDLKIGDVVQLGETKNKVFSYCFMTVTEPKPWGAQGFIQSLGENGEIGMRAYYRATWGEMEMAGRAPWIPFSDDHGEESKE